MWPSFEPRKIRIQLEAPPANSVYLSEKFPVSLVISNNDSMDVALFLDALLHPVVHPGIPSSDATGDCIQIEGEQHKAMSLSNTLLEENLPAGQAITKILYLNAVTVPGERILDISVVAKPANTGEQDTAVAVTEVARQITFQAVHPFFCDAQPTWYRPETPLRSRKSSIFELESPPIEETGYRLSLNVLIGSLGPDSLSVHNISLAVSGSDELVRLLGDTLEEDDILQEGM